jgi:hypothetical protein
MTGTRISNIIIRPGIACCLAGSLLADDVTLNSGSARLTGSVRSISKEGIVELASPLSPGPVLLKSDAVRKVEFSPDNPSAAQAPALVELVNGDVLPVAIEGFDDRKLTVVSPEAGRLEIPREALRTLQLGIAERKVVYAGPKNLDEWAGEGDVRNWSFERASLVADGQASATKKFPLPEQFVLGFTLQWQAKQMPPNFEVYFADPLKAKGEASDRYFLRFNSAGLEIKREVSKGKRYHTIVQLNRTPNQYPDRQLKVEIRADRKGSRMRLFLNGEPEGEFFDPIAPVPSGSAITFVCNTQTGNPHEISNISILELDDSSIRHRAEDRGDPKNDSLISREDDRWGGRLMEIRKTEEGAIFRFKSDFQNDLVEIPEDVVSTVFFAGEAGGETPEDPEHPFMLRLRGEGSLRLASCLFTEDSVSAVHPLLGPLNLRRDGVLSMERIESKPAPAPEP